MTLEEAIYWLNIMRKNAEKTGRKYFDENARKKVDAIDTVLKALDNSISKDEVKKKIEELEESNLEIDFSWDSDDVIIAKRMDMGKLEGFKELLGE